MGKECNLQKPSFFDKTMTFLKSPVFLIVFAGLSVRLILAPLLTYSFDIYHWAIIIQNIDSGNGLYELTGYFYTPVWGYILGFITACWNTFLSIDVFGIRFENLLGIETLSYPYYSATITSPEFNVAIKIPIIICDLIVGILVYWTVFQWSESKKKAATAFALWFLCPIVIYMSGIQAMFDSFSALLMLLTAILIWKKKYLLGGFVFSFAVLLKFFPGFCIFILIAYVIVNSKNKSDSVKNLVMAMVGGLAGSLLILLPQIMDGTVVDTLMFALGRISNNADLLMSVYTMIFTIIELFMMVFFAAIIYIRGRDNSDKGLFVGILCVLLGAVLIQPSPQYPIVAMPFLAFVITTADKGYSVCWWFIGFGAFFNALLMNNFSLFSTMFEYWGVGSADWIVQCTSVMCNKFMGKELYIWIDSIAVAFEWFGCALCFVIFFGNAIEKRIPKMARLIEWFKKIGANIIE